jgi:hypothetical protein
MENACSECGRTGGELRNVPGRAPAGVIGVVSVCETCVAPAIEKLRDIVRRVAADADDGDAEMDMLLLIALLKRSGLEITEGHMGGRPGMEGVRFGLLTILDSLERQLLCSGCGAPGPESRMHVIPWFNGTLARYVATFRCGSCVHPALAETIARLRDTDGPADIDGLGELLRQHGIHVHEWLRGDPPEVVRPLMIRIVQMIDAGSMKLALGTTTPLRAG